LDHNIETLKEHSYLKEVILYFTPMSYKCFIFTIKKNLFRAYNAPPSGALVSSFDSYEGQCFRSTQNDAEWQILINVNSYCIGEYAIKFGIAKICSLKMHRKFIHVYRLLYYEKHWGWQKMHTNAFKAFNSICIAF
jgi:hypothetical protein